MKISSKLVILIFLTLVIPFISIGYYVTKNSNNLSNEVSKSFEKHTNKNIETILNQVVTMAKLFNDANENRINKVVASFSEKVNEFGESNATIDDESKIEMKNSITEKSFTLPTLMLGFATITNDNEIAEDIAKSLKCDTVFYQKLNNSFIAVSLSNINKKFNSFIGHKIDKDSELLKNIKNRELYKNKEKLKNGCLYNVYKKIYNSSDEIVGIVRIILKSSMDSLFNIVNKIKIGKNGYFSIIDSTGLVLLDKYFHYENILKSNNKELKKLLLNKNNNKIIDSMINIKNEKHVVKSTYIKELNWKISAILPFNEYIALKKVVKKNTNKLISNIAQVMLLIFILIIFMSIYFIKKSIIKPLNLLTTILKDISEGSGDLTQKLEIESNLESKNELNLISKYFNSFRNKIREAFINLNELFNLVNFSTDELTDTINTLKDKFIKIQNYTEKAKESNENNKDSIDEFINISHVISNQIQEMNSTVTIVKENSNESVELSSMGKSKINEDISQLKIILKTIDESQNSLNSLVTQFKDIKLITQTVENITSKTNLLALNASIEASKAGAAGRGFGVVANEIKKLAIQSKISTNEINTIVESNSELLKNVVSVFSNIKNQVNKSSDDIFKTSEIFNKIITKFEDVNINIETILINFEDLKINTNKSNDIYEILSERTDLSSININTLTNAIIEQNKLIENIHYSTLNLNEKSINTKKYITNFKF